MVFNCLPYLDGEIKIAKILGWHLLFFNAGRFKRDSEHLLHQCFILNLISGVITGTDPDT